MLIDVNQAAGTVSFDGYTIDLIVLRAILRNPGARVLWRFSHDADGRVNLEPFDENKLIWLEESDRTTPGLKEECDGATS